MADAKDSDDGVQRLIDRIREQAVEAGRSEAEALLAAARSEAATIVEDARREREALLREGRREIEIERQAAHAAVHTAARDLVLSLEASLVGRFEAHVRRLVSDTLLDPELLRTLVLTLAGRVRQEVKLDGKLEVVVATLLDGDASSERTPALVRDGILGISRAMLREGVELRPSPTLGAGAKLRLVDDALEIDLSAEAISELLLAYLTPRFRWILQGVE